MTASATIGVSRLPFVPIQRRINFSSRHASRAAARCPPWEAPSRSSSGLSISRSAATTRRLFLSELLILHYLTLVDGHRALARPSTSTTARSSACRVCLRWTPHRGMARDLRDYFSSMQITDAPSWNTVRRRSDHLAQPQQHDQSRTRVRATRRNGRGGAIPTVDRAPTIVTARSPRTGTPRRSRRPARDASASVRSQHDATLPGTLGPRRAVHPRCGVTGEQIVSDANAPPDRNGDTSTTVEC